MKFTCTQENLAQALGLVSRVASKNVALPILHNVLITAERGGVRFQTTNLEVAVTVNMRAKVEAEGKYTVPSRVISDFITLLGHENVTLELIGTGVQLTSGHSKTTIHGAPADDFPVLPQPQEATAVGLPAAVLHQLISETVFAAANDESRPEISGLYCQADGKKLTLVATDSYRLSERTAQLTTPATKAVKAILPSRTAHELLRLLPKSDDEVKIEIGDNHVRCVLPEAELVSRIIDGQYPDYQQIVPSDWQTKVLISREELAANIRAASLFCKPGINDVTLSVDTDKGHITLAAANTQLGEHRAEIEAKIEGQPIEIVFNHRYLTDGVATMSGDEVQLELSNPQAPAVIRSPQQTSGLYLIMPIRQ